MNSNQEYNNNQQSQILNNLNSIPLQNNNPEVNNQFNQGMQNNIANQGFGMQTQPVPNLEEMNNVIENNVNQGPVLENSVPFTLGTNVNTTYENEIKKEDTTPKRNPFEEATINDENNQFIHSNVNYNETSLYDLNIEGNYNQMIKPDYSTDPKVIENIEKTKKNTISITKELKTFFLIALVLFAFIIIMPYIFDTFRNININ